jgi:hypothetical protein
VLDLLGGEQLAANDLLARLLGALVCLGCGRLVVGWGAGQQLTDRIGALAAGEVVQGVGRFGLGQLVDRDAVAPWRS